MKTPTKVITALALAGIAVAGGAAFTGGGLTDTQAGSDHFVGGSIEQTVVGANLVTTTYTYNTATTDQLVETATLTFAKDAQGRYVHAKIGSTPATCRSTVGSNPTTAVVTWASGTNSDPVLCTFTNGVAPGNMTVTLDEASV